VDGSVSLSSNPTLGVPASRPLPRFYDDVPAAGRPAFKEQKFRMLVFFSADFLSIFKLQVGGRAAGCVGW
jgi:hypothetical protein